ncbi:hypothetical protein MRX96_055522 [Rhipicephalus microplus]
MTMGWKQWIVAGAKARYKSMQLRRRTTSVRPLSEEYTAARISATIEGTRMGNPPQHVHENPRLRPLRLHRTAWGELYRSTLLFMVWVTLLRHLWYPNKQPDLTKENRRLAMKGGRPFAETPPNATCMTFMAEETPSMVLWPEEIEAGGEHDMQEV